MYHGNTDARPGPCSLDGLQTNTEPLPEVSLIQQVKKQMKCKILLIHKCMELIKEYIRTCYMYLRILYT